MGKKKAKGSLGMQWFTTGVSTTLVLILLGIVSFFILFAQRLSDSVKENLTVTVLLDGEASRSDIHEFRRALTDETLCVCFGLRVQRAGVERASQGHGQAIRPSFSGPIPSRPRLNYV